jgi:aspartate beta-hydroxylase
MIADRVRLRQELKRRAAMGLVSARARASGARSKNLDRFARYVSIVYRVNQPLYEHELQTPSRYFPGLTAKPFHTTTDFNWISRLETNHGIIRSEYQRLRALVGTQPHHQGPAEKGNWETLYLFAGGRKIKSHQESCPETMKILRSIPGVGSAGHAYFSVLMPGSFIRPHCGPTNTRLRCHLGLITSNKCRLRVGSETREWKEGKCLVFDDSFEHEVWNDSNEERVVLIFDFWHPELTGVERMGIQQLIAISGQYRRYSQAIRRKGGNRRQA